MDYFVEKLYEKNKTDEILEKTTHLNDKWQDNDFITISKEHITCDNRKISENEVTVYIHGSHSEEKAKIIQKEHGGEIKRYCHGNKVIIPIDFYPRTIKRNNQFAFNGILIECQEQDDGYLIPAFLKMQMKQCFPDVKFIKEPDTKIEFIEYTGGYPALCCGDTLLQWGSAKLTTKIIQHDLGKWKLDIPDALKHSMLPQELLTWEGSSTSCCGGCD